MGFEGLKKINNNEENKNTEKSTFIEVDRISDEENKEIFDNFAKHVSENIVSPEKKEKAIQDYLELREKLPAEHRLALDAKFGLNEKQVETTKESSLPKLELSDPREDDGGVIPGSEGMADVNEMGINMNMDKTKSDIDSFQNGTTPNYQTGNVQGERVILSEQEDRFNIGSRNTNERSEGGTTGMNEIMQKMNSELDEEPKVEDFKQDQDLDQDLDKAA